MFPVNSITYWRTNMRTLLQKVMVPCVQHQEKQRNIHIQQHSSVDKRSTHGKMQENEFQHTHAYKPQFEYLYSASSQNLWVSFDDPSRQLITQPYQLFNSKFHILRFANTRLQLNGTDKSKAENIVVYLMIDLWTSVRNLLLILAWYGLASAPAFWRASTTLKYNITIRILIVLAGVGAIRVPTFNLHIFKYEWG